MKGEVILAKSAGFCFGVRRAVDTVYEQIRSNDSDRKIYTFGPIIHNTEVVNDLKDKGAEPVEEADLERIRGQILIIRSHGVSRRIYEKARALDIRVVDATCPFVKKIHEIADEESTRGRILVIIGDAAHPEVQGILGWAGEDAVVIRDEEEAMALNLEKSARITVVAQTTFNSNKFNNIVEIINKKGYDIRVINTICNATRVRQKEASSVAKQVDTMLVIGDRHSSNTQKLFDICKAYCKDTYYIQTVKDLNEQNLQSGIRVGITAGASTPNNIIQEVFLTCQKKKISNR
ncbi:MAG: 4-hydroxy-3-methylbut-2-enyl diphosphate reductase [Parasporobacterium sp.]|nr:4-hydroxy-3-methylbut-2-enyl diphosphate reductase [Parasporobacterium sp.]